MAESEVAAVSLVLKRQRQGARGNVLYVQCLETAKKKKKELLKLSSETAVAVPGNTECKCVQMYHCEKYQNTRPYKITATA